MILGYVVMWLIVMIYILILANRQRNVKEEVELLQQLLKEDEEAESQ
jgi:preprotein translocase subunit YajC